jgi:hypothetical protein
MPTTDAEKKNLNNQLKALICEKEPIISAFPPCSDTLLSLVKKIEITNKTAATKTGVEIVNIFHEYFSTGKHKIFSNEDWSNFYNKLFECDTMENGTSQDILDYCFPPACEKLEGNRRLEDYGPKPDGLGGIRRLFIADLVWLYYMEDFNIFGMIRKILQDYQYNGYYPIASNSLASIVLEAMLRETRKGLSHTMADRYFNYYKVILFQPSNIISDMNYQTEVEPEMKPGYATGSLHGYLINLNGDFHLGQFIQKVLSYYKERRLAGQSPFGNAAAIESIIHFIHNLKTSFKAFEFGRSYYNTLNGIVWLVSGLSLIWELRTTLQFDHVDFYEVMSAAQGRVLGHGFGNDTSKAVSLNLAHRRANAIRSILLDLEVLDTSNLTEVQTWLDLAENKFESLNTTLDWFNPEKIKVSMAQNLLSVPKQVPILDQLKVPNIIKLISPESVSAKMSPHELAYVSQSAPIKKSALQDLESLSESAPSKHSAAYKHSPLEYRSVKIEPE